MLARYVYGHPRYFALILLCIVAIGINGFRNIPRQEDPTLTNFVGSLTVFFPGATPDRVEALITRPLEDALRQIEEVEEIKSTSSSGVAFINIRLLDHLSAEALERSWSEVRDAAAEVNMQFPAGAQAPRFENDRLTAFTTITTFSAAGDTDMPLSLLHRSAQDFADMARNLPGVRLVELIGEPQEEIRVEINESALISRGLSLQQVAAGLQAADVKIGSGRTSGAGTDMMVELGGSFDSMERIRQVIINTSGDGSATRVSDIGQVYKAVVTPPMSTALAQGRQAILIGTIMEDGNQVDIWASSFKELLHQFQLESPSGLQVELSFDQSVYSKERLREVSKNLAVGVALVVLVLLFTLGWRAAVVVAIVLPLCGMLSIAVMERAGMALHQLSITGLIVAIGLLVDGSIVMTDEIRKRLLNGHTPLKAITDSVDRLRVPLIASALTTILTFMPMALVPGPGGDFIGNMSIAVIIMLIASTLLALIVTPVLAVWLLPRDKAAAAHWYTGGTQSGRAGKWLISAMDWSLRHPVAAIALALALPISGFLALPTLTAQFFPGTDRDQLYVQMKLSDGRSIYETTELVEQLDNYLREQPLIRRVDWSIGESAPAFYYNMFRFKQGIPSWAEALVITTDANKTDDLIRKLQTDLDQKYPQARIIVRGIDQSPPVLAPLEIEVRGPNLEVLRELGEQYRQRMESIPYVTHTNTSLVGGAPKIVFQLDEEKLRLAQLQLTDAATALNDSLRGRIGGEVLEGTERLPVRVRLKEQDWNTSDSISNIRVPIRQSGEQAGQISALPLNALGQAELVPAQSPIYRFNGVRSNSIEAFLIRGVLPEEALKLLQQDLIDKPIELPQGYSLHFGGDSDEREKLMKKLVAPLGLILSAMLATIVMTFNSWRLSAISVLVCFCSFGLSLLSLAIFDYSLGIMAVTGVIGSIGVSINAAIIIMTGLQANDGARNGGLYAIRSVVMDSSRHIVSTTATTFGGFLPLILEGGQFWPPFAMAIAGGVLLSTIISFFLVPPLFKLVYARGDGQTAVAHATEGAVT
jgi:multidrug efflux pump subunit AcrB